MGANAKAHVRQFHDIRKNYRDMESMLQEMVRR
jgi:hypothetical protein